MKRTEAASALGLPGGRTWHGTSICHRHRMSPARDVTGTRCHRHGMSPARDVTGTGCHRHGMCHWELLGTIHYVPASGVPLRKLEPISLRGSGLPVGQEAISFVSSLRGCMPSCLRSHATDPTFPYTASQPNLYINSAPSGASPKFNRFIMTIVHIQSSTLGPQEAQR